MNTEKQIKGIDGQPGGNQGQAADIADIADIAGKTKGRLIVVSGPSGVGKGTVLSELFKMSDEFVYSVSATTRQPRQGETDGVNYFFKTRADFEKMISEKGLLEYAEYNGNYYGTPKSYTDIMREKGKHVILEIEVQGAMKVKALCPDALMIFIAPESKQVLHERLRSRGTESEQVIAGRTAIAEKELRACLLYDYITVNRAGMAKKCAADILSIVRADALRASKQFSVAAEFI